MCENTGRGDFGSVISQRVTHPNVLANYRSAKHPSLALVATSKLHDRWILISDPSYTMAKRMRACSYGLGKTPSRDVHAIITLAEYRSVKHPSLALVATSKLYDRWILISDPSYITAKRTLARSYRLGETPSCDVHAIITLYPGTCNPHAADPPALRSRARAARARPDYAHAHVVHLRRTRRSMRARTGAPAQETSPTSTAATLLARQSCGGPTPTARAQYTHVRMCLVVVVAV
jgi:hypothetical protein